MNADEAARGIAECVTEIFLSAENQSRLHGAAEELGVTPPVFKAFLDLEPGERVPMRDLAARWQCDASFVTVVCDELEDRHLIRRRVAEHDRRIKVVELTAAGLDARASTADLAFGPRAGFSALTASELATLAQLLRRVADAQAEHDEQLLDRPGVRAMVRRMSAQRTRAAARHHGGRGPGGGGGRDAAGEAGETGEIGHDGAPPWQPHLDAYRDELGALKDELARVRDEIKALTRGPIDEARSELKAAKVRAKSDLKATKAGAKADAKAAAADIAAEVKGATGEAVKHLKQRRRRR